MTAAYSSAVRLPGSPSPAALRFGTRELAVHATALGRREYAREGCHVTELASPRIAVGQDRHQCFRRPLEEHLPLPQEW